jgi:hypothetical protein
MLLVEYISVNLFIELHEFSNYLVHNCPNSELAPSYWLFFGKEKKFLDR